jgi:hypothetical protein
VLAAPFAIIARDSMTLASNMQEMATDVTVSTVARLSRENLIDQMTKNTLFGRTAMNIINPSFEELIRDIDRIGP